MRRFAERHFEIIDFTLVILISSAGFVGGHNFNHDVTLLDVLKGNRAPVYGAIAGLFGTMFGFAITAMSIVLAFSQSPKLLVIRGSRHWATLWTIFTRGLRVLIAVAVIAVAALIFDKDSSPHVLVTYVLIFAVLLGIATLYRIIWAFQNLVNIMARPDRKAGSEPDFSKLEETGVC